jgi:hypothetical protein
MDIALLAAVIAALVTAVGWYMSHLSNRAIEVHKSQLELVNRQLAELYGPLHVSCKAGQAAYETLLRKLGRKSGIFDEDNPPSEADVREWFHWMKNVLGPINDRRETLILNNCHLILESAAPQCLIDFASHTAAYRAILAKWEADDFSEHYSLVPFPVEIDAYAEASFKKLKARQAKLLSLLGSAN